MSKGRPQINFRVNPDQRAAWQQAADRAGRELSEWIRGTLDAAIATDLGYQYKAPEAQAKTTGTYTAAALSTGELGNAEARMDAYADAVPGAQSVCAHKRKKAGASGALVCQDCGKVSP